MYANSYPIFKDYICNFINFNYFLFVYLFVVFTFPENFAISFTDQFSLYYCIISLSVNTRSTLPIPVNLYLSLLYLISIYLSLFFPLSHPPPLFLDRDKKFAVNEKDYLPTIEGFLLEIL